MDQRQFDRLARLLGGATDRRAGLKAAFGALFGAGAAAAIGADMDAEAKRRRKDGDRNDAVGPDADKRRKKKKKCKPACEGGFTCIKGQCVCPSGIECGGACCASGKACVAGACADEPGPTPTCIAAGEPCKSIGRACCDGRVCASGQGGDRDVACYSPKTGACETTRDCVYGMRCRNGRCAPPQPGDLAQPCDAAAQQLCTTPGAVCTVYDGTGAPGGNFCSLPLESACSGDAECTCYTCWYANPGAGGTARQERASARFACCGPEGYACSSDRNCCLGTRCVNGTCRGTACVPDDARGCDDAPCCTSTALCRNNVCKLGIPTGETCSTAAGSLPCLENGATCTTKPGANSATYCLRANGVACAAAGAIAADGTCASGHCVSGTCRECAADGDCPSGKICDPRAGATEHACVACTPGASGDASKCASSTPVCKTGDTVCVACNQAADCADPGDCKDRGCTANACAPTNKTDGTACTVNSAAGYCGSGTCAAKVANGVQCAVANQSYPCSDSNATCTIYTGGTTTYCLLADSKTCTANGECVSSNCVGAGPKACRTKIATGSACTDQYDVCGNAGATCVGTGAGTCLIANTKTCAVDTDCASGVCATEGSAKVCRECAAGKVANCTSANKVCDTSSNSCVQCITPTDCPAASTTCEEATCSAGVCGVVNKPEDATCALGGGSGQCKSGTCVACTTNAGCSDPTPSCNTVSNICQACDVCPTCTYTTVQAAITGKSSGSTITIDNGTYTENLAITDKSMTLQTCRTGGTVTISSTTTVLNARINTSTARTLTLNGLRFQGNGFEVNGTSLGRMTFVMKDCTFAAPNADGWMGVSNVDALIENTTFEKTALAVNTSGVAHVLGCTFDGTGRTDRALVADQGAGGTVTVTIEDTTVQNYSLGNRTGTVKTAGGTALKLKGTTKVWKNTTTSTNGGGGVTVDGGTLDIASTVQITENRAPAGSGSGISNFGGGNATTITGATTSTVFDNYGPTGTTPNNPQCKSISGGSCLT